MIDGVTITQLKQFPDERGKVMKMLSVQDPIFSSFGEIYFSCVHPGAVKAWHIHRKMTLQYAVPVGNIKFVLFDDRVDSPTRGEVQEIFIGQDNYCLVSVPPLIWNGFEGIADEFSVVANCASIPHDPDEISRLPYDHPSIPYSWALQQR